MRGRATGAALAVARREPGRAVGAGLVLVGGAGMANPQRGEVSITVDGRVRTLRLTLGALAALEARLGAGSLMGLAERFEDGRVATADLLALLAAGLEGAREELDEAVLAEAEIEGGAVAAMRAGVALLANSFRAGDGG